MDYLPLVFAGLMGGAYIVASAAELLLAMLNSRLSARRPPGSVEQGGREPPIPPARLTSALAPDTRLRPHEAGRQKPGILIATTHRLYRRVLERWFQNHGFLVWTAADGVEAVELHRSHVREIALALLDARLPGLDGPGTLSTLRLAAPTLPCCFMSARLAANQEARLRALGAAAVFEKPLLLQEATLVILRLIDADER